MKIGTITILNKHHINTDPIRTYYIGRGSLLGNPYSHDSNNVEPEFLCDTREIAVEKYKLHIVAEIKKSEKLRELIKNMLDDLNSGTNIALMCFCAPKLCHGTVIKRILENHLKQ